MTTESVPVAVFMETARSYTDAEISKLEARLADRIRESVREVEQRLTGQIEAKSAAHDNDIREIGGKIDNLTSVVTSWQARAESLTGLGEVVRDVQVEQVGHGETLTTLQSDIYGTPARGRKTVFGILEEMTLSISHLTDRVEASSLWIEAETQRQAEARQRWANRQQAALALVKMIPVRAAAVAALGGSATLLVLLKVLGG